MPRSPRWNLPPSGTYHVFNRGVEQRSIYLDDSDRRLFLSLLRLATRRVAWAVDAYTLMENHFHLVVTTHLERLSKGMHTLSFRYAQAFNDRHNRVGHLFQGRFGARVVDGDRFFDVCDYVFANPVEAGLCGEFGAYPWSGGEYFSLYGGARLAGARDRGYGTD
jgi:REP element-mobilizing transposase RayT